MRRVIVSEFVSLDGVIEDPGGAGELDRGGWSFRSDRGAEGDKFKDDELAADDALLLGRKTYEAFATAWPQMEEQMGEYGARMNGYPKHVASRTLQEPLEWNNSTLVEDDIAEGVGRLKQQDGKDILVFGSGELARTLISRKQKASCASGNPQCSSSVTHHSASGIGASRNGGIIESSRSARDTTVT